ncbi:MAG: hypothetical protein KDJ37_06045 [Hyphomicrobiaceae bacterium]|nr:hypothetical protein [Hyphomicrobiaceae bacterium]
MSTTSAIGSFVAALAGPMLLAIGFAALFNRRVFRNSLRDAADHQAVILIAGLIAIGLGATLVKLHNVWVLDWPVLVTLAGWLSLLAGFFRTIWPDAAGRMARRFLDSDVAINVMAIVFLAIGATLVNIGFP